jgi:predicted phosphodiesterase
MRFGVIADIHGNLPALEAVVAALERLGVDGYICLGDIVGYGPFPNACVEVVAGLGATTVAGNHDLIATGALTEATSSSLAQETLLWTRDVLVESSRAYLASLPLTARVGAAIAASHGAIDDPTHYVRSSEDAERELGRLATLWPGADTLLLGHTHQSVAYTQAVGTRLYLTTGAIAVDRGRRTLMNPGSVGQPREWSAAARALWLDGEAGTARFVAVDYDARAVRAELRRQGLPGGALHLRPPPWRAAVVKRLHRRWQERRTRQE